TDPDAEHEAPREARAQIRVGGGRLDRVIDPHVEDSRGGHECGRRLQDRIGVRDMRRPADPPGAVPELLGQLRRLSRALNAERAVAAPDPDWAQLHSYRLTDRVWALASDRCRGLAA